MGKTVVISNHNLCSEDMTLLYFTGCPINELVDDFVVLTDSWQDVVGEKIEQALSEGLERIASLSNGLKTVRTVLVIYMNFVT